MSTVTQILNWISNGLLLPVIVLLLGALAGTLISLGGFCSTYLMLLQERKKRSLLLKKIKEGVVPRKEELEEQGVFASHVLLFLERDWNELECEKILSEYELACEKELDRSRFLAKASPMLGLMGTLIPMGPALAGLASGDIAGMAHNMQIAFATTVIGCLTAGVSLMISSVKKHWFMEEITDLRYVLDRHLAEKNS